MHIYHRESRERGRVSSKIQTLLSKMAKESTDATLLALLKLASRSGKRMVTDLFKGREIMPVNFNGAVSKEPVDYVASIHHPEHPPNGTIFYQTNYTDALRWWTL